MRPNPQQLKSAVFFEKGKPPAQQPYFGADAELYLTPEYLRGKEASEPCKANTNAVRVIDGDTIVLWDGSNAGEVFKARGGVLSSTMTLLKIRGSFDREYFFYAVKNLEPILKGQTAGSGIPHVDKEVLGNLTILEFQEPEQIKIAEVLSLLDKAIEQTEALIAKQNRVRSGLTRDFFTRGIDKCGNLRSERSHAFQDSALGRVPIEWQVLELGKSAIELIDGDRGEHYPKQNELLEDGACLFLTAKNVTNAGFKFGERQFVSASKDEMLGAGKLERFDIVLTTRGTVGNFAWYDVDVPYENIRINSGMIILRNRDPQLLPQFIFESLRGFIYDFEFRRVISGSAQPQLPVRDLRAFHIVRVPIDEQKLILSRINQFNEMAKLTEERHAKLCLLKDALTQDLLTGRKRVKALLDDKPKREGAYA